MAEPTVYTPSPGARLSKVDAQLVGQTLAAIVERDGLIDPKIVLSEAREATNPLHKFFTWDDNAAAAAYRMDEARRLIRSVRVVIQRSAEQSPLELRAFVRVASEKKNTYLPIVQVMTDEDMSKQQLAKALLELQAFRRKYAALSELKVIIDAIGQLPMAKTG